MVVMDMDTACVVSFKCPEDMGAYIHRQLCNVLTDLVCRTCMLLWLGGLGFLSFPETPEWLRVLENVNSSTRVAIECNVKF